MCLVNSFSLFAESALDGIRGIPAINYSRCHGKTNCPPIQKWRKKVKTWLFFGRNAVTVDEGMNLKRGGGVLLGVRFWSDVP